MVTTNRTVMENWISIISIILNVGLGGGLIVSVATLKGVKKKSLNEAKSVELENIQTALGIWRQTSEQQKKDQEILLEKVTDLSKQVISLTKEVNRLKTVNSKILKLLEKIDAENYQIIAEEIKKELEGGKNQ